MAVTRALKNASKKKVTKPIAKKNLKKSAIKKAVKKTAKKPVKKVEIKKELTVKDVESIVAAKQKVIRQHEVLAELEKRGVTSINRIPKKVDKDLVDQARALAIEVPLVVERLRKAGLGSPSRILKKSEYALIQPKPTPVIDTKSGATVGAGAKSGKKVVEKIDGEEVELEEVELEDLDALVADTPEEPVDPDKAEVRVVNLTEESTNEVNAFTLKDSEEDDAPPQTVLTAGATADPVKDYLKQIGRVALLNAELEVELAMAIEAGLFAEAALKSGKGEIKLASRTEKIDKRVKKELEELAAIGRRKKNHLLEANLRLVVSLAKRYTGRGMLFLDLIQEGNLGLIRAVEKFDYTKGYKFSTYATWWIRQAITRAMADQARTIRIPVHMVEVINKLARVQRQMLQDLGREPTPEELAKELDMTPEKVVEVQKYGREPISLHTPLGEEGDSEFGDLIEDSEAIVPADAVSFTLLQEQLHSVLDTLSEREAGVVAMRFGLTDGQPKTLDEIGKVYGVTRERIRQIESKTMSKLRHPSRSQVLRDYLD